MVLTYFQVDTTVQQFPSYLKSWEFHKVKESSPTNNLRFAIDILCFIMNFRTLCNNLYALQPQFGNLINDPLRSHLSIRDKESNKNVIHINCFVLDCILVGY